MPDYQDFFVIVSGQANGYTVEARGPQEISVPPVALQFAESEELQQELTMIQQGYAPTRERMQGVGTLLFNAVFTRSISTAFARALGQVPAGNSLRLKLAIYPPELNILPWELLYDPDNGFFPAARLSYPVVRFVESATPVASLQAPPTLRVLYIQAQPASLANLNLEESEKAVRQAWGKKAEVTAVRSATPAMLRTQLRQTGYHVLHYDGHAYFDPEEQVGAICLQDEFGREHRLSGEMLATYLDGSPVRLVVLAACESGMDAREKRFSGIAQQLMRSSSLPAVAAMQFAVPDASAIAFNHGFYNALADGYPVEAAMVEGRKAILETLSGDPFAAPDWATPVLFMRSREGNLFEPPALKEKETKKEKEMAEEGKKKESSGVKISVGKGAKVSGGITGGDSTSFQVGNITGAGNVNIAKGNVQQTIHTTTTTTTQGPSLQDFNSLLVQIKELISQPGIDPDTAEAVAGDLSVVEKQAGKETPNKGLIVSKLTGLTGLLEAAGGTAVAVTKLAPLIQQAVEMAGKLFK